MSASNRFRKIFSTSLLTVLWIMLCAGPVTADANAEMEARVKAWAIECQSEIKTQFEYLVTSGKLTMAQMFDTFYIPIPNTAPQKFHTQYDRLCDTVLQTILDKYLAKDPKLLFVVAVDRNGYLPTHNSKSQDRSKRVFNDRTGLAAARNTQPFLLQKYNRDTGETMYDLSVPIYVHTKHWGAVRFGYTP